MDEVIKGFELGFGGMFGVLAATIIFTFIAGVLASYGFSRPVKMPKVKAEK